MKTAYAVIGAQYGDEGKGLMTDYLASQLGGSETVVVRSNGGSQAGHTVVTPQGDRHVFQHFGSGTFTGARTHLSRFFVVNPIKFREERMKLMTKGVRAPRVSVDPRAMVTLPFDTLINQAVETFRGNARHGSCGHGIGETVERNEHSEGFPVTIGAIRDLTHDDLIAFRDLWVPKRLAALGVTDIPKPYDELLFDDALINNFFATMEVFDHYTEPFSDEEITRLGTVIFESAQGLALDAEMGAFPYVTRSNTGLKNIVELAQGAGIETVETFYMTRIYTTRHGAGPLARERDISDEIAVEDPTNVHNEWQGTLRFAPLDANFLLNNIKRDLTSVAHASYAVPRQMNYSEEGRVRLHPSLVVTCMDQVKEMAVLYHDDLEVRVDPMDVSRALRLWGFTEVHEGHGPTREHVFVDHLAEADKRATA